MPDTVEDVVLVVDVEVERVVLVVEVEVDETDVDEVDEDGGVAVGNEELVLLLEGKEGEVLEGDDELDELLEGKEEELLESEDELDEDAAEEFDMSR